MSTLNPRGAQPPYDVNVARDYAARGVGASFANYAPLSSGATAIVAPSSNVSGMVLRWYNLFFSTNDWAVFADTAAPSGVSDASKRRIIDVFNSGVQPMNFINMYLPPGVGLYVYASGANGRLAIGYDLL